ncbi:MULTISPECIES: DUF1796 family putative cysteine peptidase [Psychrobacillus]|uniref:Peptidase n=1 Tax=Psychrobacillus faecigallinarum TaxID=2762235 RepID=A0ABR8R8R5_9BACI|nr:MULTISPECIES: DUF1796 family putative cysteine peptidase [Psychrobacillus]MBD7944190.1 peptidase [Psychrobacillus faecigallinarum]QEY21055.1 peptidase [Psychrobacillus sp. AK 1817]
MELSKLKGGYDAVFSLGDLCLASIQLKKHNLRPFSGVLDWMASPTLSTVNELLENRFIGFMDYDNLRVIGYADSNICVSDDAYNLVSNHDFSREKNTLEFLGSYLEVMEKYERRIQRFLHQMQTAKRILFVRTEGTLEDAASLQNTLSEMVKHDFNVLLINHTPVKWMVEKHCPLEKVCMMEFPNEDIWEGNGELWKEVLSDIYLTKSK